jgi:hypothetical protein
MSEQQSQPQSAPFKDALYRTIGMRSAWEFLPEAAPMSGVVTIVFVREVST